MPPWSTRRCVVSTVSRAARCGRGVSGGDPRLAIATGDLADNQQLNEARWVRKLLEGRAARSQLGVEATGCGAGPLRRERPAATTASRITPTRRRPLLRSRPSVRALSAWPRYKGLLDPPAALPCRRARRAELRGARQPRRAGQGNAAATAVGPHLHRMRQALGLPLSGGRRRPRARASRPAAAPDRRAAYRPSSVAARARQPRIRAAGPRRAARPHGASPGTTRSAPSGRSADPLETNADAGVVGLDGNIDAPQFAAPGASSRARRGATSWSSFTTTTDQLLTAATPDETAPPCVSPEGRNTGCDGDPPRRSRSAWPPTSPHSCSLTECGAYVAGHTTPIVSRLPAPVRAERLHEIVHRVRGRLARAVATARADGQPRRHAVDLRHADRSGRTDRGTPGRAPRAAFDARLWPPWAAPSPSADPSRDQRKPGGARRTKT